MQKIYRIKTSPCARQENMIIGNQDVGVKSPAIVP